VAPPGHVTPRTYGSVRIAPMRRSGVGGRRKGHPVRPRETSTEGPERPINRARGPKVADFPAILRTAAADQRCRLAPKYWTPGALMGSVTKLFG
jgi:hypothetical protein